MQAETKTNLASRGKIWTGRIISGLIIALLAFDGGAKVMKAAPVMAAAKQMGYTTSATAGVGGVLLASTALYAIPPTAILGAILLTGYLGGATDANVHAGNPPLATLLPVFLGVLIWGGLVLRDERLRALVPWRK
ncbi:MAG TPA: DoxX family protein [Verrucomicrobiae bacterium]|nr:DoxX family protein [Verrucomicrobiae bacterium]